MPERCRQPGFGPLYRFQSFFEIENKQLVGLEAAAQQLVLKNPPVENEYLRSWYDNVIGDLCPEGYGLKVSITLENESWVFISSSGLGGGDSFVSRGTISITKTGGEIEVVDVEVTLFER